MSVSPGSLKSPFRTQMTPRCPILHQSIHLVRTDSNDYACKKPTKRTVPELRIYTFWDKPIGPHPVAMFEVDLLSPAQFGAFVTWLAVWRGPLSALIHPNTVPENGVSHAESELRDHTERAIWMGERIPLDLNLFKQ